MSIPEAYEELDGCRNCAHAFNGLAGLFIPYSELYCTQDGTMPADHEDQYRSLRAERWREAHSVEEYGVCPMWRRR